MEINQNLSELGRFDVYHDKGLVAGILGAAEAINIASRSVAINKPAGVIKAELLHKGFAIWAYGFSQVQIVVSMGTLTTLWAELGEILVTEDGASLDQKFLHFEPGTEVFEVWHWFEQANSRFKVADFMGINRKEVRHGNRQVRSLA